MRLRLHILPSIIALSVMMAAAGASAQQASAGRLAAGTADLASPAARVRGVPGGMSVVAGECRSLPVPDARVRIVDVALREWKFFGSRFTDPTGIEEDDAPFDEQRRWRRLPPQEAARVAPSIAGYWAVTPEGPWIVARQNDRWNGEDGVGARWNAPWSAAFISWVMCEGGLGAPARFQRAIAHHAYIDQAIRARDGRAPEAAFIAYDAGEMALAPGDLLCSSRRPVYRSIAERRRQMGVGARSHCDVVVRVDEARRQIHAIGGNVRGVVSLKLLPAVRAAGQAWRADVFDAERPIFAHLKLR